MYVFSPVISKCDGLLSIHSDETLIFHFCIIIFSVRDKVLNGDSNGACSEASNILLLTIINPLHPITVVSVRDGFHMFSNECLKTKAAGIKYKQSREQIRASGKIIESYVLQGDKHNKRLLSKVVN